MRSIAENLGRGLGVSETDVIFKVIRDGIRPSWTEDTKSAIAAIDLLIKDMPPEALENYIVLSTVGYDLDSELYGSEHFLQSTRIVGDKQIAGLKGRYRRVPVVEIWLRGKDERRSIVLLNFSVFGQLVQYDSEENGQGLNITVEAIGPIKAMGLLSGNPSLRIGPNGQEEEEKESVRKLMKSVHIQIWEKFEYEILNVEGAFRVDIRDTKIEQDEQ